MSYIRENGRSIVTGLLELVIGILLFIDPVQFTKGIFFCVGVVMALAGILCLIRYFASDPAVAALEQNLAKGLVLLLVGGLFTLRTELAIGLFPLLTQLYGVVILVLGVVKIQQAVDLLRMRQRFWFLAGINAVLAILFAVIILANPFTSTVVLWRVAALSLIVEAVLDVVVIVMTRKREEEGFTVIEDSGDGSDE